MSNVPKNHADLGHFFSATDLLKMKDYPHSKHTHLFYGQSAALTGFFLSKKDPDIMINFIRDGQRTGYDASAKKYYGFENRDALNAAYKEYALKKKQ